MTEDIETRDEIVTKLEHFERNCSLWINQRYGGDSETPKKVFLVWIFRTSDGIKAMFKESGDIHYLVTYFHVGPKYEIERFKKLESW